MLLCFLKFWQVGPLFSKKLIYTAKHVQFYDQTAIPANVLESCCLLYLFPFIHLVVADG